MQKAVEKGIQAVILLLLLVLISMMIHDVNSIQESARLANYAGLMQVEAQKAVAFEAAGTQSPALIAKIDSFVAAMQNGDTQLGIPKIDDVQFQEKAQALTPCWETLKSEIEQLRSQGYENTNIAAASEKYDSLAGEMVALADARFQRLTATVQTIERFIIILGICLLLLIIKQFVGAFRALRASKKTQEQVLWDENTNLPNKNKCQELLSATTPIETPTIVCMFDLHNMKYVNKNFGREVGDKLIAKFATLLKTSVPANSFIGRYGGDEFIVIISGDAARNAAKVTSTLQADADALNRNASPEMIIRYTVGQASSADMPQATLRDLFATAEQSMYQSKKKNKKDPMAFEEELDASMQNMIQALGREYTDCCYCNAKTGGYHLFGGSIGTNIPRNGTVKSGMVFLSCLIWDREERVSFLEKVSIPYISAHLDEIHTTYDVICHFHGVKRNWWKLTLVYVDSDEGELFHFLLLFKEISGEKELEFEARHDCLTGLWNKTAAFELMEEKIAKGAKQYNMLVLDLDDFKHINDTMGHSVGDTVIKKTAEVIQEQFRETDVVARFGGDEFFVFADGELSPETLNAKAARIRQHLKSYFQQALNIADVTISIGVVATHRQMPVEDLFHKADEALYTAKRQGKNQSVLLTDEEETV